MPEKKPSRFIALLILVAASPALISALGPRQNFDARILGEHNRQRALVNSPPLEWDPALAEGAHKWARYLAATNSFAHSTGPHVETTGENLWAGTKGFYQPESMVRLWADEKRHFVQGAFPNNSRTGNVSDVGHYTQLIWARTGKVGCALAEGAEEDFLVCHYKQAGNVIGEKPI